jgi:hypothetical protein
MKLLSCSNEGNSANKIEMGRIKKTIGIIREISALPALCKIKFLLDRRASFTCEIRMGPKDEPLSIPRTMLVVNLLNISES